MTSASKRTIVLLDSHAIIHRAYHALPDFATSAGKPTGALYGLVSMVLSIASTFKPDHIIACFDLPGGTFRTTLFAEYKGHRKDLDDALVSQLEEARDVLAALGIPVYDKPGFEADDLLGTLAGMLAKDEENEVIIASGDMDTLQLVQGSRIKVFTLKKGLNDTVVYDEAAVKARFGFGPKLIPDYKGLRGDPSDNIPGIAGIGEKTATTLITNFGGIDDIYKKLAKDEDAFRAVGITPRIIGLLKEGREEAEFSRELARIITDVPVECELPDRPWNERVDMNAATTMLTQLEFRSLLMRFTTMMTGANAEPELVAKVVVPPEELKKLSIAVWLLDSEHAQPDVEDILAFAKTRDWDDAKKDIWNKLQKEKLDRVYKEIEEPLIPIIERMQTFGIAVDKPYFAKLSKDYHEQLDVLEKKIFALAGREFNIKSPKQLSEILFDELKLPTAGVKKSAGGAFSTQIGVLEKLEEVHPIIPAIMEYREIQKLVSTYIDVIPDLVAADGRLHPRFIQTGAATGRFASADPNIQNIPIKSEMGKAIRGGFVAAPGYELVSADYSQIEFRLAAIYSGDEYLAEAFARGDDIHAAVAARVFAVPMNEVTKEMRRRAKVINFGILYGMGVNALKKNLGTTQKEAAQFYDDYFAKFKRLAEYLEDTIAFAKRHGYTETLFGRRRYFPAINSSIPFIQKTAERTAINAPLQGTAADIVKLAMIRVDKSLAEAGLSDDVRMLLQIHDELIFEMKKGVFEKAMPIIRDAMERVLEESYVAYTGGVPLAVNISRGFTWLEL